MRTAALFVSFSWLAPPLSAQSVLHEFAPPGSGSAVAGVGDVNGDGFADVAIGSSGRVFVYSGMDYSILLILTGIQGTVLVSDIAGAGDLDADGYDDLVVSRRLDREVRVHSGRDASALFIIDGSAYADFGIAIAAGGDVDGDSTPDIIVGAPGADVALAYSGVDGSLLRSFGGLTGLGRAVAFVGDINGDNHDDVLVGASAISVVGMAWLFSGFDESALLTLTGTSVGDQFGVSVDGVDLDSDGLKELVVGAPTANPSGQYSGMVRVFDSQNGSLLLEAPGESPGDFFGAYVAAIDIDADGVDEVLVGAPNADSTDENTGSVSVLRSDGSLAFKFEGDASNRLIGPMACAGDTTGDGFPEIIAGGSQTALLLAGPCPSPAPASYCFSVPNSAGSGAAISALGTTGLEGNNFILLVEGAIANQPGLFIYGPEQALSVFGAGFLCVGGVINRLEPQFVLPSGFASRHLDFTMPPADAGPGQITAGSTWNFQFWYRDPGASESGFNLSNGLNATFCP